MWSNCLIECIRKKISNVNDITIYCNVCLPIPHFYYHDSRDNNYYHFSSYDKELPIYKMFYFKGKLVRYIWHLKNKDVKTVKIC
jgi:hypothetical protein